MNIVNISRSGVVDYVEFFTQPGTWQMITGLDSVC